MSLRVIHRYVPEGPLLFILAAVIGLLSGGCAWLLKHMIAYVSGLFTSGVRDGVFNLWLLVIPVAGLVLTGLLCRYVFHRNLSHGVRTLMERLSCHDYDMKPWHIVTPMLASTVTLGFGGSAGSEGPIACTGAAIGGNMGRWFGLTPRQVMLLIGCGAGAGIAGIFKAPLGGALFTIEVLRIPMGTVQVLMVLVSSIVAGVTAYMLGGCTMDLDLTAAFPRVDNSMVLLALALGVFCGLYSLYYSFVMKWMERTLSRIRNPLALNVAGGVVLAVAIFLFPSLYGEGYGVIARVLNGDADAVAACGVLGEASPALPLLVGACLCVVALKCFATGATNNGGGVSGEFAPTLFAGCVAGLLFALGAEWIFGLSLPVGLCALIGMCGVMSGAIRAPLMAIVLTVEMADAFGCFMPVMITGAVAFGVVRFFTTDGFYTRYLDRRNGLLWRMLRR